MKYIFSLALGLWLGTVFAVAQNVGIGTNTPHSSAMLEVSGTGKGMLVPRMSSAQRTAIISPAQGLLVYDTDTKTFWFFNGTAWVNQISGGVGFKVPYDTTVNLVTPAIKITNSNQAPAISGITSHDFGIGIQGSSTTAYGWSVYGYARSANAVAVKAHGDSATAIVATSTEGLAIDATSTKKSAVKAAVIVSANTQPAILATHAGTSPGVQANSQGGHGLYGSTSTTSTSFAGVYGINNGTQGSGVTGVANFATGYGVQGSSTTGTGVFGYSNSKYGVYGSTINGTALYGFSNAGYGLEVVGNVKLSGGNTTPALGAVLTCDAVGNATWQTPIVPPKIGFRSEGVSTTETGGTANNSFSHGAYKKVEFKTEEYDLTANFSTTGNNAASSGSSTFLVPVKGIYHFNASVNTSFNLIFNYTALGIRLRMNRGGSVSTLAEVEVFPGNQFGGTATLSTDINLNVSDRIWIEFKQGNSSLTPSTLTTMANFNFFSGHLVYPL